ncbi:MAG TPA: hypothetical protein VK716_09510 [Terracidiphilus sp.]|jgi:hypothetical protein|nr:hypothetical protein [Terracidiphilus sp.]
MDMAVLLLIAVVFSGLHQPGHVLGDTDIWWHIADARQVTETHHFIHTDPYSFTLKGQPWVNPEWLSEMPFWLGYKAFGLIGISYATFLGIAANVLFLYWRNYLKAGNPGVALWTAALGFFLMSVNTNARTILFAYVALTAELAILEATERGNKRLLWLLPPIFSVWINLHGSWIIGMFLLCVYILCGWFRVELGLLEQPAFSREDRNRLLFVTALSLLMLLLNPYGWRLIWNPFDMALNQNLNIANVQEWQPLNLAWLGGKAALLAIALMVIANAMRTRKWQVYELAFVFFAWYAAFDHARFTFLAAVLTTPLLAKDLTRSFFPDFTEKTIPALNLVIAVGCLFVVAWFFRPSTKLEQRMAADWPLQTIASIQSNWRTLNQEHLGGLMDFERKPSFIDTRWDIFEHHGEMKDFINILRLQDSLNLLDKYQIDHVLVRQDESLAYLLEHSPGWVVTRQEGEGHDQYTLFARAAGTIACPSGNALPTIAPAH